MSTHWFTDTAAPAADATTAAAFKRPAAIWTWQQPLGRALSAVVGTGALLAGGLLGGPFMWTYWAALIAPDIAFFYDTRNHGPAQGRLSPRAAKLYNTLHNPELAVATLLIGMATLNRSLVVASLGWIAHIGLDRAMGFGPRRPDGCFY